jgi:two-component system sensor histidine kinase HydH
MAPRTIHLKKSEEYANLLIENLNHQIFLNFIIPTALKYGKIKLRDKEQYEYLDTVIRSTLHSFKVENVNIYDMNNIIAYSFDSDLMGRKGLGQTEYQDAVEGRTTLRLHQEGNRIEVAIGIPRKVQMVSFAPLRAEKPLSGLSGPVLGVIEVVQDITSDYRTIFDFQILVIATSATIMGVLFVVLIFVVKRGEGYQSAANPGTDAPQGAAQPGQASLLHRRDDRRDLSRNPQSARHHSQLCGSAEKESHRQRPRQQYSGYHH